MKQMVGMFVTSFPDLKATTSELIAEDDKVVGLMTATGTHTGEFMGIPASGKSFTMSEIHVVRIVEGLAVEHWGVTDDLSTTQQIGAIPSQ